MNTSQNSFSELIQNFIVLQNNAFLIMQKVSESVTTDSESISFELSDVNGNKILYNMPSYKFMKSYMDRIDNTLQTMLGLNDTGQSIVRNSDGTWSRIYQAKVSKEPAKITQVDTPLYFRIKPNWFFENFLNPLLYISVDISKYVPQNAKRIQSKRIILTPDSDAKITLFNENVKGRNDIVLDELISWATKNGITYVDDEDIRELPLSILRYHGSFDVINIKDVNITSSTGVVSTDRKYYLNTLMYSDNLSTISNNLTLATGNQFIVKNSIYEITSVDVSTNSVTLKNVNGYDPISIGADILALYSDAQAAKQADIPVGYGERQVVFFKSIDDENYLLSTEWSKGTAFFTNDLKIITTSGEQTLYEYYQKNVTDFGKVIIGAAKENPIPVVYGEVPNTPTLTAGNFQVVQVNSHIFSTKELDDIRKKGADKVKLASEIAQLEKSISDKKQVLGNTKFKTEAERRAVKNSLDAAIRDKTSKSALYASTIAELTSITKDDPATLDKPKYRIRGFFDIPSAVHNTDTGEQNIIQFEYAYRYLKLDGTPSQAQQFSFTSANNQVKRGTFSPWNFVKSPVRKKYYDPVDGNYKWKAENIEDPEVENINQIDIPITKGEKVEIKVRAISEAGWPLNPILSGWSNVLTEDFPIELLKNDEAQVALSNAAAEETRVKFQETLNAQGLDLHLSSATQTGNQYWPHHADTINSGFFDTAGMIISLYEKLKSQDLLIKQLQDQLNNIGPTLDVKIIDETGNAVSLSNGSSIKLFAGYYVDEIAKLAASEQKGAIITKKYVIQLSNTGGTNLELISRFPGGLGEKLESTRVATPSYNTSSPDVYDYFVKRKYDMVPICNMSLSPDECNPNSSNSNIRSAVLSSGQLKSQFMYLRYKDIGLINDLYIEPTTTADRALIPTQATGTAKSWIWDTTKDITTTPTGGGKLTEFCIHTKCPILQKSTPSEWNTSSTLSFNGSYMTPQIGYDWTTGNWSGPLRASAFKHAYNFNVDASKDNGTKQLTFMMSTESYTQGGEFPHAYGYPDKLGFYPHDRYLIGRQTCGAYLFVGPATFDQLLVDGTDFRAKKIVKANDSSTIQIPIYFQYRMTDFHDEMDKGFVGGWSADINSDSNINLTYEKRIGLDIYMLNETAFSFDVDVTAKYAKTTVTEKVSTTATTSIQSSSQNINKSSLKKL